MRGHERNGTKPTFSRLRDRDGLRVADPIEGAQFDLHTTEPVDPRPVDTDPFYFPVDVAVRIDAGGVELPQPSDVFVRTADGGLAGAANGRGGATFDRDAYNVELTSTQVKLYLAAESAVTVRRLDDGAAVEVADPPILVGARSLHERPAGTVTTTERIRDVMAAVSTLGSALKTLSPERSFPTLRGHPPLLELGEEYSAPDGIEPPDTGVTIEVPPDYGSVFAASSLAYYLGATVVPGEEPTLVADGVEHPLSGPAGFEREVGRVLRQTFFLDCLVRTEGYYPVDLHERAAVEDRLALDFADLYDRPLAEQVAAYVSVPFPAVADHLPTWKLTTDVLAYPRNVEVLPFTANELGIVRCPATPTRTTLRAEPDGLTEFYRDAEPEFTRSVGDDADEIDVVQPSAADSLEQAWVGDGFPIGASKATADSYRRRLERTVDARESVGVEVVCNDPRMRDEEAVSDLFGARGRFEFDVSVRCGTTADELRALLTDSSAFLHYVGHVEDRGIQCADGFLDARELDDVGVDAFLLNACSSYLQGHALVERGAIGGIVTLSDVGNRAALRMGRSLARALNEGFPLSTALSLSRDETYAGNQYIVVGDGNVELVQSESGAPYLVEVVPLEGNRYEATIRKFPTSRYALGSFTTPNIVDDAETYLGAGTIDTFAVTGETLEAFLDIQVTPVKMDGELYWSDAFSLADP